MKTVAHIGRPCAASLVLVLLFAGCAAGPPVTEVARGLSLEVGTEERVRIVVVGDTGEERPEVRALLATVAAEDKDLVVVLGDLVYPVAPPCPEGTIPPDVRETLDRLVGEPLTGLGAPTLLVLGNHDVGHVRRSAARESCFLAYAEEHDDLVMPALAYAVDVGVGTLALLNTNALTHGQAEMVRQAFDRERGWHLLMGHHVLRTYADKRREDFVRPWLQRYDIQPDLYANGHSHLLQFGVYWGIPAITSGASARLRHRASCPPGCGRGQQWGASTRGYAVLDLTPEEVEVRFKDTEGKVLFEWTTEHRRVTGGGMAPPEFRLVPDCRPHCRG